MLFWYQAIFLVTISMTVEVLVSWAIRSFHVQELTTLGGDAEPWYKVMGPRETKGESRMKCKVKAGGRKEGELLFSSKDILGCK